MVKTKKISKKSKKNKGFLKNIMKEIKDILLNKSKKKSKTKKLKTKDKDDLKKINKEIKDNGYDIFLPNKKERETFRLYSIVSSKNVHFYEKIKNEFIPIKRKEDGKIFANEGSGPHEYEGNPIFHKKMIFIDLGMNIYLPLIDLGDGEILLSTCGTKERFRQIIQEKKYLNDTSI